MRGGRRVLLVVMAHLDGQNNSWIKISHTSLTTDQQAWSSLQGNRNLCFHDTKHHSTDLQGARGEGWGTGRGVGHGERGGARGEGWGMGRGVGHGERGGAQGEGVAMHDIIRTLGGGGKYFSSSLLTCP